MSCNNCGHSYDSHFIVGCVEQDEVTGEECGCMDLDDDGEEE